MDKELKSSIKMKHVGKVGLLKDKEGKTIHDDSWYHADLDDDLDIEMSRFISSKYSTKKVTKSLIIDLEKGRTLDKTKLVKKKVPIKGKDGKIHYGYRWVDPNADTPSSNNISTQQELPENKFETSEVEDGIELPPEDKKIFTPNTEGTEQELMATKKKVFDLSTKEGKVGKYVADLSREQKEELIEKYQLTWKRNENDSIDWKNAVVALKDYLMDNAHLAGAEHLPTEDSLGHKKDVDGTDTSQNILSNLSSEQLYEIMKNAGICDGVDPRTVDKFVANKTAELRHFNNMGKLKGYLKDNPQILDKYKNEVEPSKEKNKEGEKEKEKPLLVQNNNDLDTVLKNMSREDKYDLCRQLGICEDDPMYDPNLVKSKMAPMQHMRNMMALKSQIAQNPNLLAKLGVQQPDTNSNDTTTLIADSIRNMSSELKEILTRRYKNHPIMKNRRTSDDPRIDWMHTISALKKLYEEDKDAFEDDQEEWENDRLRNMKISNKNMEKILRRLLGLRGEQTQVSLVDKGKEWGFGMGSFARVEDDDNGTPVLSVVDTGRSGTKWNEHVIPMKNIEQFLNDLEDLKENKPDLESLHLKPLSEIEKALSQNFNENYTSEVGKVMEPYIRNLWNLSGQSREISTLAQGCTRMGTGTLNQLLRRLGVKLNSQGTKIDTSTDRWKEIAYGDLLTETKEMNANDYLITDKNGNKDTWALHRSAKQWTPEERSVARMDLIKSRVTADHKGYASAREHEKVSSAIHQCTTIVPFDLFSDMLADGLSFETKDLSDSLGLGSFSRENNVVNISSEFFQGDNSDVLTMVTPNSGGTPIMDTVTHEFAHAIDRFLSGNKGAGEWNTDRGRKYLGSHTNCLQTSYDNAVKKSNPHLEVSYIDYEDEQGNVTISRPYHKDEWIDCYEGIIYNDKNSNSIREVGGILKDTDYYKPGTTRGTEHWSTNMARFSTALALYKKDYENSGELVHFNEWSKYMERNRTDNLVGTDAEALANPDIEPWMINLASNPDQSKEVYGFLCSKLKKQHPELWSGINYLLNRGDFIGSSREEYNPVDAYSKGDFTRKSLYINM